MPSPHVSLSSGSSPLRRPGVWLPPMLTLVLAATLVLGACSVQREVLSEDLKNRFKAVLLTGTPEPETPPSPRFKQFSAGQVERSLRRIMVRVSKIVSFNLGNPKPFHTEAQITWAKKVIVERIPQLNPDQRLQLHYTDQFHKFLVEVEIWADGNHLVYYFTKLAAREESLTVETIGDRPANWVTLVEQPGQSVSYDDQAYILKDQLFSAGVTTVRKRMEKLDTIQAALTHKIIDANESRKLSRLVEEAPRISLGEFKDYLDKRETLKKAFSLKLLSQKEFETRRDRLKKSMIR